MQIAQSLSDTLVVKVDRSLDFRSANRFKQMCLEQVSAGKLNFVLDFSETGILDSTGLGSIFAVYRHVSQKGGKIIFAAASKPVEVVVKLTRTNRVFPQYASVEAALSAVQTAKQEHEDAAKSPGFNHASMYAPESE